MSQRKLIVLTVLVLALFAFVFLFERKTPTTGERLQKGDLVWELPEDHIDSIRLEKPGSTVELARSSPTSWRLVKPDSYPADSASVSDVLSQLARLRRAGGDASEAKPEDYGLKSPTAKATISWKDDAKPGKKLSRTLEFGIDIPGTETTAARTAGTSVVYFVPMTLALAVRKAPDEFKTKEVFPGSVSDAARLDVEHGRGRLSLEKKDGAWWLRQPFTDLAENAAVEKLIGALTALRALEFLPSPQGQGLASFGLTPPLFHAVLADAKGPGTAVDFGSTRSDGNSVYARRENQVFTVASSVAEELSREAEAYREPRLVRFDRGAVTQLDGVFGHGSFSLARKEGGWSLAGRPLLAPAADDLVTALLDVKSKAFVDEAAAQALASREAAATVTVKLSAGGPWTIRLYPKGQETHATVSGRPGAFLVGSDAVSTLETAFQKAAAPPPATSPTVPAAPPKKK